MENIGKIVIPLIGIAIVLARYWLHQNDPDEQKCDGKFAFILGLLAGIALVST